MWRAALASGRRGVCGGVGEGEEVVWDGRAPADWWEAAEEQRVLDALPLADLDQIAEGLGEDEPGEDVQATALEDSAAAPQAQAEELAVGLAEEETEPAAGEAPPSSLE